MRSRILVVSLALAGAVSTSAEPRVAAGPTHYVILANGHGRGSTAFATRLAALGGAVENDLSDIGVVVAQSADPNFAQRVRRLPGVKDIAEDRVVSLALPRPLGNVERDLTGQGVNTEPSSGFQWNLRQIGADLTAAAGFRGRGAVVAVVDSGINTRHAELKGQIDFARSRAFTRSLTPALGGEFAGLPDWEDDNGHGSHVAGIIAAAINDYRIQGVAPEATIVAVKVLGADNTAPNSVILAGLVYAASLSPDVINVSIGDVFDHAAAGGGGVILSAYNRALNHAAARGALIVASAGNESADLNSRLMATPVQFPAVMGVAATAPYGLADFDRPASYTNYGQSVIDIAAPGGDVANPATVPFDAIFSTWAAAEPERDSEGHIVRDPATGQPVMVPLGANTFAFAVGTSMAAPHVSAVAALLVGRYGRMLPSQLEAILENTAVDIFTPGMDPYTGRGRVDAAAALGLR